MERQVLGSLGSELSQDYVRTLGNLAVHLIILLLCHLFCGAAN